MLPLELARYLAGSVFLGRKLGRIWDGDRERSDQRQTNAPHSSIADQRINNSTGINIHTLAVANSSVRQK
jgi:hypothetical protein